MLDGPEAALTARCFRCQLRVKGRWVLSARQRRGPGQPSVLTATMLRRAGSAKVYWLACSRPLIFVNEAQYMTTALEVTPRSLERVALNTALQRVAGAGSIR